MVRHQMRLNTQIHKKISKNKQQVKTPQDDKKN